ncbi:MAG: hypothetical protein AB1489_17780 [Acidobacteriota bacterium]
MSIRDIEDVAGVVSIMDIKHCSNGELIARLISSEQPSQEQESVWCEFLARFEHILVKEIRFAFQRLTPRLQPSPEEVCNVVDKILLKLLSHNHRALHQLSPQTDSQIEGHLATFAYGTALIYLYSKNKGTTH